MSQPPALVNFGTRLESRNWIASGTAIAAAVVVFFVFFTAHLRSPITIPLRADPHNMRNGFYSVERNRDGLFVWTAPHAEFTVPGLDRRLEWKVTLETRTSRPRGVSLPRVRIGVDGVTMAEQRTRRELTLAVVAPRRTDASGVTISIDTTPAYAPSRERRQLGVAVRSMTLEPVGGVPGVPWRAAASGVAALLILTIAVAASGAVSLVVGVFAGLVALGQAAFLARGLGPYLQYPTQVLVLAAALGTGFAATIWGIEKLRRQRLSSAAICAGALSLAACYLKLLMLLHADMPIGDGLFHAHRFEYVLAGRLYFTSLTPDNYAFPYPIFLYLVSAPFAWLTSDSFDRLALLRIITTVADASAASLLYWMIVRATADKVAGVACVVWYHAIPVTAWMITEGALTNAFAQTMFVASLALVVGLPIERTRLHTIVLLTIVAAAALLTHPSTCAILMGVLAITSAVYAWHGGRLYSAASGVALAAASAATLAVVLYYAWFPSVYVSELGRAASASATTMSSDGTSLGTRLAKAISFGEIYFGWPAITAAAIGAWSLFRSTPSPRLTLLLLGWVGTCLVFLVLGIMTPIEMRYHFAAFPALAICAAFACSWALRSHVAIRLAMSALVVAGVADGVSQWLWALSTYARIVR
jgi:hypothetical protein